MSQKRDREEEEEEEFTLLSNLVESWIPKIISQGEVRERDLKDLCHTRLTELFRHGGIPIQEYLFASNKEDSVDRVVEALSINDECGYSCVLEFVIPVGDVRYDPVGPDGYGYFAYDPYDGTDAPEYDWIEIAPLAGGPGTDLQLGDDQAVPVPLPFSFRYYGVDFTEISVCSHGWVCMGAIEGIFFPLNICIPHIVPPNNTIAAFWDELSPTAGGQV